MIPGSTNIVAGAADKHSGLVDTTSEPLMTKLQYSLNACYMNVTSVNFGIRVIIYTVMKSARNRRYEVAADAQTDFVLLLQKKNG